MESSSCCLDVLAARCLALFRSVKLRTLFVPLVDRMSSTLSTVLHVSNLGETGASDSEELCIGQSVDSFLGVVFKSGTPRTVRQMA